MRPTRVTTLAVVGAVCALATWLALRLSYTHLPPLPWTGVPALLATAVVEAFTGYDLQARIAGRRGRRPAAPLFVTRMVALAKATSLAAAAIAGLALGFLIYTSSLLNASTPRQDALAAAVTLGSAVVLACAALYLEYCCRVPNVRDDSARDSRDREDETRDRSTKRPSDWHLPAARTVSRVLVMKTNTAVGANSGALVTRPLLVRFVSTIASSASFYLLLSAVPEYARSAGAGAGTAGLATTALTLSSVAAYLTTPRLTARYGYRTTLAVGLAALGAPALVLAFSANMAVIMAVCVVRGAGFALVCVAGGALTVSLIPPRRRGEGLALAGLVAGGASVACLPLGVWLAGHVGYRLVFLAGGAVALGGLASVPWLPQSGRGAPKPADAEPAAGIGSGLRSAALMRPAVTFAAVTMGIGIVVTFLPLALPRATGVAALALLIQPATAMGGRWVAGRYGDRHGSAVLLAPGVLVAAAGLAMLGLTSVQAAVIAGAAVFGVGVGVTQNASQTVMYSRVAASGYSTAGAIWNLAYDGGMGLGAAWFGLAAAHTGYPAGFALTAGALPAVLAVLAAASRASTARTARASGRRGRRTREPAAGLGHETLEASPGACTTAR